MSTKSLFKVESIPDDDADIMALKELERVKKAIVRKKRELKDRDYKNKHPEVGEALDKLRNRAAEKINNGEVVQKSIQVELANNPPLERQEPPKPKAPKQEPAKPKAPKQEPPKPPKQEPPKPEPPKQEPPKPEPPKPKFDKYDVFKKTMPSVDSTTRFNDSIARGSTLPQPVLAGKNGTWF